jgi:hypothetical protein
MVRNYGSGPPHADTVRLIVMHLEE